MKIYETGESLAIRIRGDKNKHHKTYVCVMNDVNQSLESAFTEMHAELVKNPVGNILPFQGEAIADFKTLTVKTPTSICTLAHELIYDKKGNKILTPSNLLRYLFTRTFTKDTLYLNEDNEIVDMMDATYDVTHRVLNSIQPFRVALSHDNELLFDIIYMRFIDNYAFGTDIELTLRQFPQSIKPFTGTPERFRRLLEKLDIGEFLHYLKNYPKIQQHLFKYSGLTLSPVFVPDIKAIEHADNAYKEMLTTPEPALHKKRVPEPATSIGDVGRKGKVITFRDSYGVMRQKIVEDTSVEETSNPTDSSFKWTAPSWEAENPIVSSTTTEDTLDKLAKGLYARSFRSGGKKDKIVKDPRMPFTGHNDVPSERYTATAKEMADMSPDEYQHYAVTGYKMPVKPL